MNLCVAVLAHQDYLPVQLDGAVAKLGYSTAEHVTMQPVLVGRVFVGVQGDGSMNFTVMEISNVPLLVLFIILIKKLLHLLRKKKMAILALRDSIPLFLPFLTYLHSL